MKPRQTLLALLSWGIFGWGSIVISLAWAADEADAQDPSDAQSYLIGDAGPTQPAIPRSGSGGSAPSAAPSVFGPAWNPPDPFEVAQRVTDPPDGTDDESEEGAPGLGTLRLAALQRTREFGTIGESNLPPSTAGTGQGRGPFTMEYGTREFGTVGETPPQRGTTLGTIRRREIEYRPNMSAQARKVEWEFQDGLTAQTTDGYFSLTFHNLTQVDYRTFNPSGDPLHDQFFIPRQRWYFLGNASPFVEYYTVINRGYNSLDLLDAFADFNTGVIKKEKFRIRVGRMKTPFTYEYIKISETDLIAPERSVFVGNFAPNRQEGAMMHGQVFEERAEYAVGVFNGPRRSFGDYNNSKDLFLFLNTKPFLRSDCELLEQLNLGGSYNFGNEHNPTQPAVLRTASDQSSGADANGVSPVFYTFNPNVFEQGMRMQWSADLTYYYKSFGLMAGYQGGYQNYGLSPVAIPSTFVGVTSVRQTHVNLSGWEVTAFYFITGEEITRRAFLLEPRNEFDGTWRRHHMGAYELFTRFANLAMSDNSLALAQAGLASSNRANVIDNGVNWYVNHYTKLTFDWQYAYYPTPVQISPTKTTTFNNIFWLRAQLFF
jgi:phosphate-selective porin OprO/OprP